MKEITLMKLMLTVPDLMNQLKLNDIQIKLVQLVQNHPDGLTTSTLSLLYDITTQSASSRLKALWLKGYLERSGSEDGTGGIIYIYKIANSLNNIEIISR